MNWIYSKWWKWLSVFLLFYVICGSFFVQLGPGITRITPVSLYPDSVHIFQISTYHSHFNSPEAGKMQIWFKNQNNYYVPLAFQILSNDKVEVKFSISSLQQKDIKPSSFDVVINNDLDGTFALRDALTLVKSTVIDSSSQTAAITSEPEVKNNRSQLQNFPYREILYETIRNTFFHVPMWFVMTLLVFASMLGSILYLIKGDEKWDILAHESAVVALLFGTCGYLTGLIWAKYTWYIGTDWLDVIRKLLLEDVKMAAALVAMFFYVAYLLLRGLLTDRVKSDKIAAGYNIFAFVVFIMCVFVLPRLTDSMHPGNGGNPAFSKYDLDSTLRMFFYPAVIGWILLGFWILSLRIRMELLTQKQQP